MSPYSQCVKRFEYTQTRKDIIDEWMVAVPAIYCASSAVSAPVAAVAMLRQQGYDPVVTPYHLISLPPKQLRLNCSSSNMFFSSAAHSRRDG